MHVVRVVVEPFVFAGASLEFVCDKKPGCDTPLTTF